MNTEPVSYGQEGTRPRKPKISAIRASICSAPSALAARPAVGQYARHEAHLKKISRRVTPAAHADALFGRAGWHNSGKLKIPKNINLLFLPSRASELNPTGKIWHFLRQTYLSDRVFETYDDTFDAVCQGLEPPHQAALEDPLSVGRHVSMALRSSAAALRDHFRLMVHTDSMNSCIR